MATNYLMFSEVLRLTSEKQALWWHKRVARLAADSTALPGNDEPEPPSPDCDIVITTKDLSVWFNATEGGRPFDVGRLVQEFFQAFKLNAAIFRLTWATTCSHPRVGEFGGGFMVVTHADVVINTAHELARETVEAMTNPKTEVGRANLRKRAKPKLKRR